MNLSSIKGIFLFLFLFITPSLMASVTRVAIIYDGPPARNEVLSTQVKKEISSLIDETAFVELDGSWNLQKTQACIQKSLADPQIDLIVTMGIQSSYLLLQEEKCSKPVAIGYNLSYFSEESSPFPLQSNPLVAFYESSFTVPDEIETFSNLVEAKTLVFTGDASLIGDPDFSVIREKIFKEMGGKGIMPLLVPLRDDISPLLDKIEDKTIDGIVFLPTYRLDADSFSTLIERCNQKQIPTFSILGEDEVQQGILMSQMPRREVVRAARRVALNVQELLLTGHSTELSPTFRHQLSPVINEQTAEGIALGLSSQLKRDALLLSCSKRLSTLSFYTAVQEAIRSNLELLAKDFSVKSGMQNVVKSFSRLLPQVFFQLEGRKIDSNSARNAFGLEPENLIRSTFLVNQTLYDERKAADFFAQRKEQKAREYQLDSFELDVVLTTAIAYLSILRVEADICIAKENISLSKAHLNRAQQLVDAEMARLSEVYRWESEVAANQDQLVSLIAFKENLETNFNRLLNRPLDTPVQLEDFTLSKNLATHFENAYSLKAFKQTMIQTARENSPELKSIEEMLAATNRQLTAAKRAFYLPEFAAFGEFSNFLYQEGAGINPPPGISNRKLHSKVGIRLTYPLFTSGRRVSEKNQAYFETQKVKTLRDSLIEQIDESVIQTVDLLKASFESIHFAETAACLAEKNLKLVTESYAKGEVSIVDLLDAQHQMIISKQEHVHTLYDYFIDYMKFQRAISHYEVL